MNSAVNRRRFIEEHHRDFMHGALPMVELPLRLKRKLCIEWNHSYVRWMQDSGITYDWTAREFVRETTQTHAPDVQLEQKAEGLETYAFTGSPWRQGGE
jgi:hypothetical protein